MIKNGAFMEEKQGFERPAFFLTDGSQVKIPPYDFYGNYGYEPNRDSKHIQLLEGDCKYDFSDHHALVSGYRPTPKAINKIAKIELFVP